MQSPWSASSRDSCVVDRLVKAASLSLFALLVVGSFVLVTGSGGDGKLATAAEAGYEPVTGLEFLMEPVDDIYTEMKARLESNRFRSVRKQANFLAEMMNVTAYYDHSDYSTEKGWKEMSFKSRDLLLEMGKVAKGANKNKEEAAKTLADLYAKVDASCEACHEKYRDI